MKTLSITTLIFLLLLSGLTFAKHAGNGNQRQQCKNGNCPAQLPPPEIAPPSEIDSPPPPHPPRRPKGKHGIWNSPRGLMRERIGNRLQKLRENNPEEFEKLMKLRRDDPRAFRQEVHKRFREEFKKEHPEAYKKVQEMAANRKKIYKLKKQYNKCESDEEKAAIKKKIRKLISKNFDINQELREKEIGALDKKTKELRKRLRQHAKNKKKFVDKKLNKMLNCPMKKKKNVEEDPEN